MYLEGTFKTTSMTNCNKNNSQELDNPDLNLSHENPLSR